MFKSKIGIKAMQLVEHRKNYKLIISIASYKFDGIFPAAWKHQNVGEGIARQF